MNELQLDIATLRKIADFFALFGDITRIKIISALSIKDMCVGEIAELLGMHQSTVSHQLRLLKDFGIVDYRREGKVVIYFIENVLVEDVMGLGVENVKNSLVSGYC